MPTVQFGRVAVFVCDQLRGRPVPVALSGQRGEIGRTGHGRRPRGCYHCRCGPRSLEVELGALRGGRSSYVRNYGCLVSGAGVRGAVVRKITQK